MGNANLLAVCLTSFVAVFVLLGVLAGVMEIIMKVFPQKTVKVESTHVAVISSTYQAVIPGAQVTRIEEAK